MLAAPAFAQRGAGSKIAGEYNFYGRSAASAMRSAREYAGYYQEYVQSAPARQKVNPEVAREAADSIGIYIGKAQKHMASMRKVAEASNDKATLASLDLIDKHLAEAAKSHADMKDTCLKDEVEGGATLECCKPLHDHLGKAIAEHDKLMKRLANKK
jgi:hypothetical protein